MSKNEKFLYQENKLAYDLVLAALAVNTAIVILVLKAMEVNYLIGSVIMFNIVLSLFGFLLAIKLKKYFKNWAIAAFIVAIIQYMRIVTLPELENLKLVLFLDTLLVISGTFMLLAGVITFSRATKKASINTLGTRQ